MSEERLKLAVFVDFDNIQIGVKDTLRKEFDVSLVLEALKERGEVMTKIAYGDWAKAGEYSRQMSQHAVQMVQRNVTPRGDKNGADINLALDALEMAFNRPYINAFVIVGGDSDFVALVEKLKQYDKRVFIVGGRAFTSNILQRNCHEFISYENLMKAGESPRASRASRGAGRPAADARPLSTALPNVQRALKILAEREVSPQVGLLKSTLLQLDPTFSERDYGASTFLEFMQKMERAGLVRLRRTDRSYLVEPTNGEAETGTAAPVALESASAEAGETPPASEGSPEPVPEAAASAAVNVEAMGVLKQVMAEAGAKAPHRPLYLRQINQALRAAGKELDARRHGFRGILDLLHQAQREGWLRLHRDRKGVWRVFPVVGPATPGEAVPPTTEIIEQTAAASSPEFVPAEVDVTWDDTVPAMDEAALEERPPAEAAPRVATESAPAQEAPERKPRKPRVARGLAKGGTRRSFSRRKPKEPSGE
jgi:uncharacterized protein (TIGR00288 family)